MPWSGAADAADIAGCFRLLLGRRPNREEWPGHGSRAGEPLDQVVASIVNSLEFSRRGLLTRGEVGAMGSMGAVELTRLPGFAIHTAADDAAVGRHVRADTYEADVTALFRTLLQPGAHVLDLGANIGYFTMLSASLVGPTGSVIAVEPNPANARLAEASRRANGFNNVVVAQVAAAPAPGLLALHCAHSNGTTSAPPGDAAALLDAQTVGCVRAETLVPPGRRIDLIKVDVEGAEYLALQGCAALIARDRPRIITEFSPSLMPGISGITGPAYLSWLQQQNYRLSVVQPDGSVRPADPAAIMAEHARRGTDHLDLLAEPLPLPLGRRVRRGVEHRLRRWLVAARQRKAAAALALLLPALPGLAGCAPRGCDNPYVLDYVNRTDRAASLAHAGLERDAVRSDPGPTPDANRCAIWERVRGPDGRIVLVAQRFTVRQTSDGGGWEVEGLPPRPAPDPEGNTPTPIP